MPEQQTDEAIRPALQGDPHDIAGWALESLAGAYGLTDAELGIVTAAIATVAMEAREQLLGASGERTCSGCGCSDSRACPGGCVWATETLCSRCVLAGGKANAAQG